MIGHFPEGVWLNVGCGNSAPAGWINIDGSWQAWLASHPLLARAARAVSGRAVGHWPRGIECRDVRKGLGRAADTAAVIYSSHLIEHLERHEALALLVDAHRTLCPGGVCRVVTPDLGALVAAYERSKVDGARDAADRFIAATLLAERNGSAHASAATRWYRARTAFHFHKWLYDAESLKVLFADAGFSAPRLCSYLDSRIALERLRQVEDASRVENGAGIVVEATK
jgi:predicted SAM-dependent methyltransferase